MLGLTSRFGDYDDLYIVLKMAPVLQTSISKWIFPNENRILNQMSLIIIPRVQLTITQYWFYLGCGLEQIRDMFIKQYTHM